MISVEQRRRVAELRAEGLGPRRISERVGISRTSVIRLTNPEYAERSRVRARDNKRKARGVCRVCGGETRYNGQNGVRVSTICTSCQHAKEHDERWFTEERVIESIREWGRRRGAQPVSTDWNNANVDSDGYRFPSTATVLLVCGSWANAVEAAGFPRPRMGHNPLGRKKGQPSRITLDEYVNRLRAASTDGRAPAVTNQNKWLFAAFRKRGLTWVEACELAGVTPYGRGRRS